MCCVSLGPGVPARHCRTGELRVPRPQTAPQQDTVVLLTEDPRTPQGYSVFSGRI